MNMNIYDFYKNILKSDNIEDVSEKIKNLDKNTLCDLIKMFVSKINLDHQMNIISNLVNDKTSNLVNKEINENNIEVLFMEYSTKRLICNSNIFNGNIPNIGDEIYIENNNKFYLYKVRRRSFSISKDKQKIKCVIDIYCFPDAVIEEKYII